MRLDPKYFNLFIGICAIVTLLVILYGTFSYVDSQKDSFQKSLTVFDLQNQKMAYINNQDSLRIGDLSGEPVVISFWATWSGKSKNMQKVLLNAAEQYAGLKVVAATVRDDDDLIKVYISETNYPFIYTDGSELFHRLQVPGIPAQILVRRDGTISSVQVGEDRDELTQKIENLMSE